MHYNCARNDMNRCIAKEDNRGKKQRRFPFAPSNIFPRFIICEAIERRIHPGGIGGRMRVARTRENRMGRSSLRPLSRGSPDVGESPGEKKSGNWTVARARAAKFKFPRSRSRSRAAERGRPRRCRRCNAEIRLKFSRMGRRKCRFLEFPGVCQVAPRRTSVRALRGRPYCDQHGGEEPVLFVGYRKSTSQAYRHFAPLNVTATIDRH